MQFYPSPVEEDVIRMLLEAEEQLIIDEDFIIEEDEEQGNINMVWELRTNGNLHKHKLYYTKWLRVMVNMILEHNSQIGKPWTISIRLVDQSFNQYRINQLVYK